jgi:L-amino acid N-acyltransferase YncA
MAVKIRPIALTDAASYRECFDAVAKEGRHFPIFEASPLPVVRANLRKRLRKKTSHLVAVDGERVVGWAAVFRPDLPSLNHNADLVIGLLPEYRRRGLGTKLVTALFKIVRDEFEGVTFCFFDKNKPARKLAKRLGFALCGREKKRVKFESGFEDQLITQKHLRRR